MTNAINLQHSNVDLHGAHLTAEAAEKIELLEPTHGEYEEEFEMSSSREIDVFIRELGKKVTYTLR